LTKVARRYRSVPDAPHAPKWLCADCKVDIVGVGVSSEGFPKSRQPRVEVLEGHRSVA
jgi:hypothetical protein